MLDFINGLVYWEPSRNAVRNGEEEESIWVKLTKQMISLIASKSDEEEEVVLIEAVKRNDELNGECFSGCLNYLSRLYIWLPETQVNYKME